MSQTIALFDLDNTLLAGDSDYAWCDFLIKEVLPNRPQGKPLPILHEENEKFMRAHDAGTLDMGAWWDFSVGLMSPYPIKELQSLQDQFIAQRIVPIIAPAVPELLAQHRTQGHTLILITATNHFVASPIAKYLNIPHVLACRLEERDGHFTGKAKDPWCFREGKLNHLQKWLNEKNTDLQNSIAYSDSHNDLPLLEAAHEAVAVNPDPTLLKHARMHNWRVLSLREGKQAQAIPP
jgi:HAD superfamily hydrolase (TIGR01490 family)